VTHNMPAVQPCCQQVSAVQRCKVLPARTSGRPVAFFGSLQFHCYESGDPRGVSASLMPGDRMFSMVLRSGVQQFQAAAIYAEIFYCEDRDGRWRPALFSVSWASIWMEPFWLLVLEISAEILDNGQEDARLSCFELCRRFSACSISRPPCISDRVSKSVEALGGATFALRLTRQPSKCVWGDGSQCLQHLDFAVHTVRGLQVSRRRSWMRFRPSPGSC
jgi:hypothetical protein